MVSEISKWGVIKLDSEQFRLNLASDIDRNFSAESIQRAFSYDGVYTNSNLVHFRSRFFG